MAYELTRPHAKLNAPAGGCGCRKVLLDIVGVLRIIATRLPAPSEKQGGTADAGVGQAQDSTTDQLRRLSALAIERGLYDADDVLRRAREREWAQTDDLARLTAECERLRGERCSTNVHVERILTERDALRAELATVTRERDELRSFFRQQCNALVGLGRDASVVLSRMAEVDHAD